MKSLLLTAIALLLCGCASTPPAETLPKLPLLDDRELITVMSRQLHMVHDVTAQGELHLTEADGQHVTLDVAMAIRLPQEARLRAWKFGQAIFDLTVTPQGVWLLAEDPHAQKVQVSANQIARSLSLLSGEILDEPGLAVHDDGSVMILTRHAASESTVQCTIDRPTRTIRKYEILDDQNVARFSLTQSRFIQHDAIAWPQRMVAVSDRGTIDIELHDIDLNAGLPPDAFAPPRRAMKLP